MQQMWKKLYKNLPDSPGVYLMKNAGGELLYIGKAGNLRRRVSSYFQKSHDARISMLVSQIKSIGYEKTDSALEALILESALIKKHRPPYNIRETDDKSFLFVGVTKESFPRILLIRGKDSGEGKSLRKLYGPFTSASQLREALRILRRIFPYSTHPIKPLRAHAASLSSSVVSRQSLASPRPCFDYQIGLCPGTCIGAISKEEYQKTIRKIILFFEGKKRRVITELTREMRQASKALEFEKAAKIRGQIFALTHIQDVALINGSDPLVQGREIKKSIRIEGYDISNISGTSAVGSMVVFTNDAPDKKEYRKFRIQTLHEPNDVGMLREVLRRRFKRAARGISGEENWPLPHLVLVDGGKPQVNAARAVLSEAGIRIPVVGIAKGPARKKNELFGAIPNRIDPQVLVAVRDEAHRFAISYHKKVRSAAMYGA